MSDPNGIGMGPRPLKEPDEPKTMVASGREEEEVHDLGFSPELDGPPPIQRKEPTMSEKPKVRPAPIKFRRPPNSHIFGWFLAFLLLSGLLWFGLWYPTHQGTVNGMLQDAQRKIASWTEGSKTAKPPSGDQARTTPSSDEWQGGGLYRPSNPSATPAPSLAQEVARLAAGTKPATVRASTGLHPFLRGMKNPEQLARAIELSLQKDPSGSTIIDPARCKQDRSCASPSDYLAMFKENDPEAGLTKVDQLPAFIRSLVEEPPGADEYYMACLKKIGDDEYAPFLHCMKRVFTPGEKVWVDPKSNRKVLAGDCTNPVEKPVEQKQCMEIMVFVKTEPSMKFAHLGPSKVPDACLSLRKVETNEMLPLKEYYGSCDFAGAEAWFGEAVREEYCIPVSAGTYILTVSRVPYGEPKTRHWWVFCWTLANGESSQTMRVRDFDYIGNDMRRARIFNSRKDMEAQTHRNGVSHLWIPQGEALGTDR